MTQTRDLLSPFLFIICSEGLSSLMHLARQNGSIRGAKESRYDPCITHLLLLMTAFYLVKQMLQEL